MRPNVLVDPDERILGVAKHPFLIAGQRRGRKIQQRALRVTDQVDHAEYRVVLGVDRGQVARSFPNNRQHPPEIVRVQILQGGSHPHRALVALVEDDVVVLAIHPCKHYVIPRCEARNDPFFNAVAPCLIDRSVRNVLQRLLGINHAREFIHLLALGVKDGINRLLIDDTLFRRLVDLPEVGILVLEREAHQRVADAVLLGADDVALTLQGDVGDDVDNLLSGAHRALGGTAAHAEAFAGADVPGIHILALQRNIVLVRAVPGVDRLLFFEPRTDEDSLAVAVDRVDSLGQCVESRLLLGAQSGQIRLGVGRLDPRTAVLHLRIDLGDLRIALGRVPVPQIFLEVTHVDTAALHLGQQRTKLEIEKVFHALGGATVEEFFLQVRIEGVTNLFTGLHDRLNNALRIDVLVLQRVDHVIHLRRFGDGPAFVGDVVADAGIVYSGIAGLVRKSF